MFSRQFPENLRALTRNLFGTFPEPFFQLRTDFAVVGRLLNHRIERASTPGNHDLVGIFFSDPFEKFDVERSRTLLVERGWQEVVPGDVLDRYIFDCDLYGLISDWFFDMHMDVDEG